MTKVVGLVGLIGAILCDRSGKRWVQKRRWECVRRLALRPLFTSVCLSGFQVHGHIDEYPVQAPEGGRDTQLLYINTAVCDSE